MRIKLGFIAFLTPFVLFSQSRVISVDAGTSIFMPLENNTTDNRGGIIYNKFSFETRASTYLKISAEKIICSKNRFSFSMPFALGYREQIFSYRETGLINVPYESYYLCYLPMYKNGSRTVENISQMACASFGPKLSYSFKKLSIFTSLNINYDFVLGYNRRVIIEGEPNWNYITNANTINLWRLFVTASVQNGFTFQLNERLGLGISCDLYLMNLSVFNPDARNFQHVFNLSAAADMGENLGGRSPHVTSTIINTGLRLQYKF